VPVLVLPTNREKVVHTVSSGFTTLIASGDFLPFSRSLAQTLSGLHTAVQGVCELRNKCGFASHGSGSERPVLETIQALLAAETADAIVGFLHRVHRQDEDSPEFNLRIDELHEKVRIFEEEFAPSKVLFELAPEPYRLYLGEFKSESESNDDAPAAIDANEKHS
jgi:Abortive infection C-terminus